MEIRDEAMTGEQRLLAKGVAVQRPVSGTLELLPLCNMHCNMCYIRESAAQVEAKGGLRTEEEWLRLAEEMEKAGVLFLLLSGGEPLLFPAFRRLYTELKNRGMILTVNTNGTLLDEEWADFFAAGKPRRINITLYGSSEETYGRLCRCPDGFGRAVHAVSLLRRRGVDVKINGSVTKENRQEMEAIYRIGRELGVPVHMDTYMLPGLRERNRPPEAQSRLLPEEAAAAEMVARKQEISAEGYRREVRTALEQVARAGAPETEQTVCLAGNCSFAIGWQGQMRPCVTWEGEAVSVFEKGFEAAWREMTGAVKTPRISLVCRRCHLRPLCKVCVATARWETGSYDGVPEYLCRYTHTLYDLMQKDDARMRADACQSSGFPG